MNLQMNKLFSCAATRDPMAVIGLVALGILAQQSTFAAGGLYTDITTTQSYTTFVGLIPISGLSLTLPAATADYNAAIVTLDMPNLRLSHPTSSTEPMSAQIQVVAPFSPAGVVSAFGGIGCDTPGIKVSAIKPITMVIEVPLGSTTQPVEGEWDSTGGTVSTEQFASISAILIKK